MAAFDLDGLGYWLRSFFLFAARLIMEDRVVATISDCAYSKLRTIHTRWRRLLFIWGAAGAQVARIIFR
jgi:hypothetical protein